MANLSRQGSASAAITYSPATSGAGGDVYTNSGKERVHVRNAGGSPCVVTVHRPVLCNFNFSHDTGTTVSVPAGADRVLGPFDKSYNDGTGKAKLTYDQVTSVTVALI